MVIARLMKKIHALEELSIDINATSHHSMIESALLKVSLGLSWTVVLYYLRQIPFKVRAILAKIIY